MIPESFPPAPTETGSSGYVTVEETLNYGEAKIQDPVLKEILDDLQVVKRSLLIIEGVLKLHTMDGILSGRIAADANKTSTPTE